MDDLVRICFVVPSLSSGGAERVVSVLASQLARDGYSIAIIKYFDTMRDYPIDNRVQVLCVAGGDEKKYHSIPFIPKIKKLRELLEKTNAQYVVPFLPHVSVHTFLAGLGLNIKWIQTIRNAPNVSPASRPFRYLRNALVAISYRTFVQTESQKVYFPTWLHKKIFVLPNPVSDTMFFIEHRYTKSIKKIVSVGRLSEQKNFKMLILSVVKVHSLGKDIELKIYGEGELKYQLQKYIDSLGCKNYCSLCGRSENIASILAESDLFVLSSNYEGMPNALMEAMTVGQPCIATDCETGPAELINSERGILVRVGDVEAMTAAICRMVDDPHMANCMGDKAKSFMRENYSQKIIAKQFVNEIVYGG